MASGFNLDLFPFTDYEVNKSLLAGTRRSTGKRQSLKTQSNLNRMLRTYEIVIQGRTDNEVQTMEDFRKANQIGSSSHDFLIEDPKDNEGTGEPIGTGDGSTTVYNVVKDYGYGDKTKLENVRYIQSGTDTFYIDGNAQASSSYTLDRKKAEVDFDSAPASGTSITADFKFYRKVQFLDQQMEEQMQSNVNRRLRVQVGEVE